MSFKTYRTVALMACWVLLPAFLQADDKTAQDKDKKDQAPPSSQGEPADRLGKVERGLNDLKTRIDTIEGQMNAAARDIPLFAKDVENHQRMLLKMQRELDALRAE